MSLGENIYKLRTGKRMSQEDFASAMEVSRQSVSKWENDMAVPELEKLVKMAKLFEVSLDELVGNVPPQPAPESSPEPTPVPTSTPSQNLGTKESVSILLLICACIIPPFMILYHHWIPVVAASGAIPPVATIVSAHLVPKNKFLFRAYQIFHFLLTLVLLFLIPGGFWLALFNWGCMWFWFNKQD